MKRVVGGALTALALVIATGSQAAVTDVSFSFLAGPISVASGSFSYDASDTGVISYSDLLSYNIAFPGQNSYDLAFVNSGNDSDFKYFGFDTGSTSFVSSTIDGYPQIISDIKGSFDQGFFIRQDSFQVVRDYGPGGIPDVPYDTLAITVTNGVPETSTWAMMLLGFGGLGFLVYRKGLNSSPNRMLAA